MRDNIPIEDFQLVVWVRQSPKEPKKLRVTVSFMATILEVDFEYGWVQKKYTDLGGFISKYIQTAFTVDAQRHQEVKP